MIPLAFLFRLRMVLAIQYLLCFHTKFRIVLTSSVKSVIGILMGNHTETVHCCQ